MNKSMGKKQKRETNNTILKQKTLFKGKYNPYLQQVTERPAQYEFTHSFDFIVKQFYK